MDTTRPRSGIRDLVRQELVDMPGYEPVEPIDVMARRLGIPPERILKLDGNENPYGPSPKVAAALAEFQSYNIYPDPAQTRVRQAVAEYVGVEAERIVLGSGSDELLGLCAQLFLVQGEPLVNAPPTFGMYEFLGRVHGARVVQVPRQEDFSPDLPALEDALREGARLLFLASPNNPTGNPLPHTDLGRLLDQGVPLVLDEAYVEFGGVSAAPLVAERDNLIVVRTFSKWAGLAGLRAGYAILPADLVDIVWRAKVPYNLSVAAEQAILASLADAKTLRERVRLIVEERERMAEQLASLTWLRPYPSEANFVLCEVRGVSAKDVRDRLRERGVLIRYFDSPGVRNYIRISVGRPEQTDRLIEELREIGAGIA